MKRAVLVISIAYLVVLLLVTLVMHTRINQHWLATLWLFSPRWVVALPLLLLVPLTLWVRPRTVWLYLMHAALIWLPILGFQTGSVGANAAESSNRIRVLTCNLGGGQIDLDKLCTLIQDRDVELVMLQECKQELSKELFTKLNWNVVRELNISIGSVHDLGNLEIMSEYPRTHYRAIASIGCDIKIEGRQPFRAVSVHLPTFRPALEQLRQLDFSGGASAMLEVGEKYRQVASQTRESVGDLENRHSVIVAGDFNVPLESVYYQDQWGTMENVFSDAGFGFGYTKFTSWHGVRIDHIVVGQAWQPVMAEVGPDLGGDHRPLISELSAELVEVPSP